MQEKFLLGVLRISMGWVCLYAGLIKIFDPAWTAAGYMQGAKTFTRLFQALASSPLLPVVNFLNEWGLTLLGLSLILGLGIKISTKLGALLMLLYYFPVLDFPYPNAHSLLIDDHIIYALVLLFLGVSDASSVMSFKSRAFKLPIIKRNAWLKKCLA